MTDISIVQCGGTATGKSTYLAALIGMDGHGEDGMYDVVVEGNTESIRLRQAAEKMIVSKGRDRKLKANEGPNFANYQLKLTRANVPVVNFLLSDYAGGQLANEGQVVEKLTANLKNANALLLYVPMEALLEDVLTMSAAALTRHRAELQLLRYGHFIDAYATLASEQKTRLPCIVMITRFDLNIRPGGNWHPDWHKVPAHVLRARLAKLFPKLLGPNGTFKTFVCPVSLGLDLGKDFEGKGDIDPYDLFRPVGAAVYEGLLQRRAKLEQSLTVIRSNEGVAAADLAAMSGLSKVLDWLIHSSQELNSKKSAVNSLRHQRNALASEMQETLNRLSQIIPLVEGLKISAGEDMFEIDGQGQTVALKERKAA